MGIGELFNILLVNPTVNILLLFYFIFTSLSVPGPLGFSIILLTAFARGIMHPFYSHQTEMAKKMEELKPHLAILEQKHKGDKKRIQQEQVKLYQEMGINPAMGCLFAIIQIPVFIGLYQVFLLFLQNGSATVVKKVNAIVYTDFLMVKSIDPHFFGLNLAVAPSHFQQQGLYYLAIPVITAILQYQQVKLMTPTKKALQPRSGQTLAKKDIDKKKEPDFQTAMATQMKYMFPVMIGYFAFILPVGLSFYWNVFSIFSILQAKKK